MDKIVKVYGAGLAGCEAAWQVAQRGIKVRLYEMKPKKFSPAHHSEGFSELVCSNSLRSDSVTNAVGLLKEEMRRLDSLIMQAADATRVPAGSALAVDRDKFSAYITEKIRSHENIEVVCEEMAGIDEDCINIIATGPLTSDAMSEYIQSELIDSPLHFFDAAAPIVDAESINMDVAFFASRYDKGDADYINCPMNEEQYNAFWSALVTAEEAELKEFDRDEQKKNIKAQRKNAIAQKIKEVKFHINIDQHDYDTKLKKALDFLEKKYRVKITLALRGREMAHQDMAFDLMKQVTEALTPYAEADGTPKLMGRNISVNFAPK